MASPDAHRRLGRIVCVGLVMVALAPAAPSARAVTGTHPSNQWAPMPYDDEPGDIYQRASTLEVYRDKLYAGVQTSSFLQIWRTADGLNWDGVITATNGMTDSLGTLATDFAVHDDALFATTFMSGWGGAVWRTLDGDEWEPVTPLWASNTYFFSMAEYKSRLYVDKAIDTLSSAGMWHTVQVTTNGVDWSPALEPGFSMSSLAVAGDWLYVGGQNPTDQTPCLWRFDGSAWSDVSSGFGASAPGSVMSIVSFGTELYAAVATSADDQRTVINLWHTSDGDSWAPVLSDDLLVVRDSMGMVMRAALVVHADALFLFTYDLRGGGVWRSPDGVHWDAVAPRGWDSGQARGVSLAGAAVFRGQLWAGLVDTLGPSEVMLYLPNRHPLPSVLNAAGSALLP